ncbi:MAG: radical SAM protein, partial [Nitrospirae bacterium]
MNPSSFLLKLRYLLYVAFYGRFSTRPYHCQFQITRRCNLRCQYCLVWRKEGSEELTLKDIGVLAENLRLSGLKSVVITGGEPLLRDDIVDVIELFKRYGLIVRLQTNGMLLNPSLMEDIFRAGLDDIYVSLDTLRPDRFMALTGCDNEDVHKRLIENLKRLSGIAKKHGSGRFLLSVITPQNADEVEGLVSFARRWGYLIGLYGIERAEGRLSAAEIRVSLQDFKMDDRERAVLRDAFREAVRLKKSPESPIFNSCRLLRDYIDLYSTSNMDMHWRCQAGRHYIVVLPDGRVSVCNATEPIKG